MVQLVNATNGGLVQAVPLPPHGSTTTLTTAVGNAATASALAEGLYRVYTPIDANICAGATADATDLFLAAGSAEYFYFNGSDQLAAFCSASGSTIFATLV